MTLNSKQRRTLRAIFTEPTRADVSWKDFESLVKALGGEWSKGGRTGGSRRRAKLNGIKGLFHHPHPGPVMKKGSVDSAKAFLRNAGATPEKEG